VLRVAADAADRLAGSCASDPPVMVKPNQLLSSAVELMERQRVTHLLVGDPQSSSPPIGVLSSLDVAGIIAWGRG
jgi:CBS domain-containing protein